MTMDISKAIDRVRKYLSLATSGNEHEAAEAAARAAALMSEYQLTEAMLKVDDDSRASESIVEGTLTENTKKRVAWRCSVASAVAHSLGGYMYYFNRQPHMLGRESAVQAWAYTCEYLFREIDALAQRRWEDEKVDAELVGHNARSWMNAFRVGAAQVVARRLRDEAQVRTTERKVRKPAEAAPIGVPGASDNASDKHAMALAVIEREEREVESAYRAKTKGWRTMSSIGSVSNRSGYHAGKEAGAGIALGGGRAALNAGQGRLK